MKKCIAIILAALMILTAAGCAANADMGGMAGMDGYLSDSMSGEFKGAAPSADAEAGDAPGESPGSQLSAGTLTAGEWNDAENLDFWRELLNGNDWYALMENWDLYSNNVVRAYVHDGAGNPCYGVPVSLCDSDGNVLFEAVTGLDGYANLLYNLRNEKAVAESVLVNGNRYPVSGGTADITVESAGIAAEQLDLMLMIDTTGSMTDELQYLQAELENVVSRVAGVGKALSIHVSVNFYRDEGDEYVIREFEFTPDTHTAIQNLNKQVANGGGDYPEAVHTALDSIVNNHQWRDNAVKLCFFVLDAPPHSESEIQGINAQMLQTVTKAAKNGIRIIPVASSGVNTDTEFLLRSWALMTGGTYLFLTDHSGIGNSHLEPTIGEYQVEFFNECMIRVICEYCGLVYLAPENNAQ